MVEVVQEQQEVEVATVEEVILGAVVAVQGVLEVAVEILAVPPWLTPSGTQDCKNPTQTVGTWTPGEVKVEGEVVVAAVAIVVVYQLPMVTITPGKDTQEPVDKVARGNAYRAVSGMR